MDAETHAVFVSGAAWLFSLGSYVGAGFSVTPVGVGAAFVAAVVTLVWVVLAPNFVWN